MFSPLSLWLDFFRCRCAKTANGIDCESRFLCLFHVHFRTKKKQCSLDKPWKREFLAHPDGVLTVVYILCKMIHCSFLLLLFFIFTSFCVLHMYRWGAAHVYTWICLHTTEIDISSLVLCFTKYILRFYTPYLPLYSQWSFGGKK